MYNKKVLSRFGSVSVVLFCFSFFSFAQPNQILFQAYKQSVSKVIERAEKQKQNVSNAIVVRHLNSISNLVQLEYLRLSTLGNTATKEQIEESKKYTDSIAEGLSNERFNENDLIVNNKRSMVMSFLSSRDKSLQYYIISLPANFNPQKKYPLLVSLHGSGPSHPLFYPHVHFLPIDDKSVKNKPDVDDYIRIIPWGRGNAGYAEYAESDLWECLEDVTQYTKINPDRRYLEGHSMGARGAYNYAVRRPDYWAAVALYSLPLSHRHPSLADISYAKNLNHTPVYLWLGEKDREIYHQSSYSLKTELEVYNAEFVFKSSQNLGHTPSSEEKVIAQEWLFKHLRKAPSHFHYINNQPVYRGVWGINMNYNPESTVCQSMECAIEENNISVVTTGTSGISVVPAESGFGLVERGKIYWNGKVVYEGEFNNQAIKIGEINEGRRRR